MMAVHPFTCVAIDGRGVLVSGPPGSGKSSLALALIDRGAILVGDDGVLLRRDGERLLAQPHPETRGLFEVRNLGLLSLSFAQDVPIALLIRIDAAAPRFIEEAELADVEGVAIPSLLLHPQSANLAIKAELALERYGLRG